MDSTYGSQKVTRFLLRPRGSEVSFPIAEFDGSSGLLESSSRPTALAALETMTEIDLLLSDVDQRHLWSGLALIRIDGAAIRFELCVQPISNGASAEPLSWREVPRLFSVFDGGYDPLSFVEVGKLLDDLTTFHTQVYSKVHFEDATNTHSINGSFGFQESLKELSELLIDWSYSGPMPPPGRLMVLELELFESVYFILGLVAEADQAGIVITLTQHVYIQSQRSGRRIPLESVQLGLHPLLEVSDFGMKLAWTNSTLPGVGDEISLPLCNTGSCRFTVVYRAIAKEEKTLLGLRVRTETPEECALWQRFILQFQYPLLSTRNPHDHSDVWNLLEESQYLVGTVGSMVAASRESVLREWTFLDKEGPAIGAAVLGRQNGKAVATIGVARASGNVWVAQAAAVLDDPKYLEFTRSIYGWRTRAILQQEEGQYHLAFFAAHKPFLDRFFRKFYLALPESEKQFVTWDEWMPTFLRIDSPRPGTSAAADTKAVPKSLEAYSALTRLRTDPLTGLQARTLGGALILNGRPHQHLAQFLASIWLSSDELPSLHELEYEYAERGHPFVILMSQDRAIAEKYPEALKSGSLIPGEDEVVWTCHRRLLPRFLANSLKALEIMVRKYGIRQVA